MKSFSTFITTLTVLAALASPALANTKSVVTVVRTETNVETRNFPGINIAMCATTYSCSSVYTYPSTGSVTVVYIFAVLNGQHAILSCIEGFQGCSDLEPGDYKGNLRWKSSNAVTIISYDGRKKYRNQFYWTGKW